MAKVRMETLRELESKKLLKSNPSPDGKLLIWNYTEQAQYERVWNEYTMMCRGLITDLDGNIVARPFAKFFNFEELESSQVPSHLPYKVYEKLDGSLGILYWHDGLPYIATRGSFSGNHAQFATDLLQTKYKHLIHTLKRDVTYLFEIIYPKNRVVINYGDVSDIFLLAMIDEHGKDLDYDTLLESGFRVVKQYPEGTDFVELKKQNSEDSEGVVVMFANGFRMKSKNLSYIEIHKKVSKFSALSLWKILSSGEDLMEFLSGVPDEFYQKVRELEAEFHRDFKEIKTQVSEYAEQALFYSEGKERASFVMSLPKDRQDIVFREIRGLDISPQIWKLLKPKQHERPTVQEEL